MEPSRESDDDLRPEYDLSQLQGGVRGKYAGRKRTGQPTGGYEQTSGTFAEGSNGSLTPEQREFLTRLKELEPILRKSVLPIVAVDNGRMGLLGTGTLFRVADVSFLITAAHVAEKANRRGLQLYTLDYASQGRRIQLHGEARWYPESDVLVLELHPDVVAAIPNRQFLTVHHADRGNRRPKRGTYLIHGYPELWFEEDSEQNNLTFRPLPTVCGVYEGSTDHLENYDPKVHILLNTPKDGAQHADGTDAAMPDRVHGMSGCSIWQVLYEGLNPHLWSPDDAAVVAVQTGVYQGGKITKGTRWWVVDQIIRHNYPELARSLSLVIP